MSKYKLVPVKPTQEMIDAALKSDHAEISPRKIVEQDYKAMLAAAPDVDRQPIGWLVVCPNKCLSAIETDRGNAFDLKADLDSELPPHHSGPAHEVTPLYRHPPAPDVTELLEALTPQVLDWMRCGLAANGRLQDGDHPALAKLRAAIDACRSQGGEA